MTTRKLSASALIIRPLTRHSLDASGLIWSIYLEATSPLGRWLRRSLDERPVVAVPPKLVRLLESAADPAAWLEKLEVSAGLDLPALDPRLEHALGQLAEALGGLRIDAAARSAGLSKARLRTLARRQLGVPLATWLLWQKLERAGRAVASGMGLAEAAQVGGFADQPHFARTMQRMFGMTPSEAAVALS